ncbi:hypothetical protein [Nocardia lijiangensis]|uniref:hypothetical protein n=1 Tax=Nocardia lijiangensis TaxID=299618 RepID=UPI00082AEA7E|nr:hypothetical protein [Nocardia lijiangensis]
MQPEQARAAGLFDAALTGELRMPEQTAQRLASACDALLDGLRRLETADLGAVHGFPELPSGIALARGFSAKGAEFADTLTALQEATLRYKAGYLAAGQLVSEADAAHRAALELAADRLDDGA